VPYRKVVFSLIAAVIQWFHMDPYSWFRMLL